MLPSRLQKMLTCTSLNTVYFSQKHFMWHKQKLMKESNGFLFQSPKYKQVASHVINCKDLSDSISDAISSGEDTVEDVTSPNQERNGPQYFVFASSPKRHTKRTLLDRVREYTAPMTTSFPPLLSTRSLQQYQDITSTKHSNKNTDTLLLNRNESDEFNGVDESSLMSEWSAGFTIINIYLGLGLLSYPYALCEGGFISFIILALFCIFMSWTGKLLVRCFIRMKPSKKTYPDVGYAAFRSYGVWFISVGIICEFFGVICTNCIFMWDNAKYGIESFTHFADHENGISTSQIALWCSVAVLPTCWMLNLSQMSFVSFLGCTCKILTVLSVVVCFVLNIDSVHDNISNHKLSMYPRNGVQSLSICCGIFILSFAGHPVLPGVYNAMRDPQRFEALLDKCFACLFVIYSVMALFGYLQFAQDTNVIITQNLMSIGGENTAVKVVTQVVVTFIVCGLYFQISPLLSLLAEIPEMIVFKMTNTYVQCVFRTGLFVFCAGLSYLVMDQLAAVEAITGSVFTMITSVIAPAAFYFAIYTNYISSALRFMLILCALLGILFALLLLFNDLTSFN
eukprot:437640_1